VVVVTADSHVGPRIREDLRPYCPSAYLDEFDAFVASYTAPEGGTHVHVDVDGYPYPEARERARRARENAAVAGHYDMQARLDDMDRDGIAAEVIFHGSQNGEPFPFITDPLSTFRFSPTGDRRQLELVEVGQQIYNRWLADACAMAPGRRVGLVHLPLWNIEASIAAVRDGHKAGLTAVNFPATPRPGMLDVDYAEWEPFWATCEDLGMPLVTHCGAANPEQWNGPTQGILKFFEGGSWLSRRALPRFIFSGVFERHPRLRLMYTELANQASTWWPGTASEFDQAWQRRGWMCREACPRPPSEYMYSNVFVGASLLHRYPPETHIAINLGHAANILWGSDYPHVEGTLSSPAGEMSTTRVAMQLSFAGVPERWTRRMLGENSIDVFGLDEEALTEVAHRISAPTPVDLAAPPPADIVPSYWSGAD
jgi:predicted TIM-barrel fold metal-dependent hydrolase